MSAPSFTSRILLALVVTALVAAAACRSTSAGKPTDSESTASVDQENSPHAQSNGLIAQEGERTLPNGWVGAGQPTEERLLAVVAAGAIVLSLRAPSEDPFTEDEVVTKSGGEFVRLPMTLATIKDPAYRQSLYQKLDALAAEDKGVFLHCGSGDRVGAAWALYRAEHQGADLEAAIAEGKTSGLRRMEPAVREVLSNLPKE